MRRTVTILIAAGALLLGACGGDDVGTAIPNDVAADDQGAPENQGSSGEAGSGGADVGDCPFLAGVDYECSDGMSDELAHIPVPDSAVTFGVGIGPEDTGAAAQDVLLDAPMVESVEFYLDALATGGFETTAENGSDRLELEGSDEPFNDVAFFEFTDPDGRQGRIQLTPATSANVGGADQTHAQYQLTVE